ncbi:hypothetical protein V5799_012225 [Amblyomma americanum]|uniref:Uncharacterized protein n=1 Tax=Amblyomma americanum TaxID=6943 RepID=A0AAQ4EFD2_AMBAM
MAELCTGFISLRPNLLTFKFSGEQALVPEALRCPSRWKPCSVPAGDIIFGNVSYQLQPVPSRSLVVLKDDMETVQLTGVKQAVVAMETNSQAAHRRLSEVASRPECWSAVSSLCLVPLAPCAQQLSRTGTSGQFFIDAMELFFGRCLANMTELNLASFHFDCDTDGSHIVSCTLPNLRALALTPCGANHAESLRFLARGCRNLEQLDIWAERDSNRDCLCATCRMPLLFSAACFRKLHGSSAKFRRLALGDTARMTSLDFLRECRVMELLLNLDSFMPGTTDTAGFHVSLSRMLRANPRLSLLEIKACCMPLRHNVFAAGLAAIPTLQHLCVLTEASTTEDDVASFFRRVINYMRVYIF